MSITSSIVFKNVFSTPDISSIWSDTTRTSHYLAFEDALARVQASLNIIPHDAAEAIAEFCLDVSNIDFEELRGETEKIGYPVLGVVKQIVRHVNSKYPGNLGEWTHWGATTQDVTDTATILQLRSTLDLVSASLANISGHLQNLARIHASTPMAARSNLQQAVPITFGFKLARLLSTFRRHQERLDQLTLRVLVLEFGGAAGTLAALSPQQGLACQKALAKQLGLSCPEIAWHTERDRIAELGGFFALVTGTCAKFVLDVKLLTQTEIGEVSEPFYDHRGSSSTMPQKRNPISCAYVTAMASTVRQHAAALYDAMVADHERSTGPWEIEWIVLPQMCMLTCAALKRVEELVGGLEVHTDAMRKNLDVTKGGIVSEAVMMGLAPTFGRQYAHDLVYKLCRRSVEEDVPLLELLCSDEKVKSAGLTRGELERLCDPAEYLGLSVEMTRRVVDC
ncbi:L-Aspartase-like protein [Phlebopus sp. FC_14]|nr:L-Aspartase-like protein [Phlebopus sp. FC_14]